MSRCLVFSFALVFAFIFEKNGFVKIMDMFRDQVFSLGNDVLQLLTTFFHLQTPI